MEGRADFDRALGKARSGIEASAVEANRGLAEAQAEQMRGNVPVDTGRLRDTIRVETSAGRVDVVVGYEDDTDYLGAVEFGTRFMMAQPFVRPAVAMSESRLEGEQTSSARKAIGE